MNYVNLQKMYNYIEVAVPSRQLNMWWYTNIDGRDLTVEHSCNSIGCVIGHCVNLDIKNVLENFIIKVAKRPPEIDYLRWSLKFLDIEGKHFKDMEEAKRAMWNFMFSASWGANSITNSKEQILARLKYVLVNKCVPEGYSKNELQVGADRCTQEGNNKYARPYIYRADGAAEELL